MILALLVLSSLTLSQDDNIQYECSAGNNEATEFTQDFAEVDDGCVEISAITALAESMQYDPVFGVDLSGLGTDASREAIVSNACTQTKPSDFEQAFSEGCDSSQVEIELEEAIAAAIAEEDVYALGLAYEAEAALYEARGDTERQLESLTAAIEFLSRHEDGMDHIPALLLQRADVYFDSGRFNEASIDFYPLAYILPDSPDWYSTYMYGVSNLKLVEQPDPETEPECSFLGTDPCEYNAELVGHFNNGILEIQFGWAMYVVSRAEDEDPMDEFCPPEPMLILGAMSSLVEYDASLVEADTILAMEAWSDHVLQNCMSNLEPDEIALYVETVQYFHELTGLDFTDGTAAIIADFRQE